MLEELPREVSEPRWTWLSMTCWFWPFSEQEVVVVVTSVVGVPCSLYVCVVLSELLQLDHRAHTGRVSA